MEEPVESIPNTGWSVRMDHVFDQKRSQKVRPTIMQALKMIPLFLRYVCYYIFLWYRGRVTVMDFFNLRQINVKRGAPIGGIGCGSIGRSIIGEFCNFQMVTGFYEEKCVDADQFIITIMNSNKELLYQKVLCAKNKAPSVLTSWDWQYPAEDGDYTALYPRSWYVYNIKECNIKLICRQISPVIPHNYEDSSIPGAVFIWKVINKNSFDVNVSLTFTFQNGTGSKTDKSGAVTSNFFNTQSGDVSVSGVSIMQNIGGVNGTYCIGCTDRDNTITRCPYFDPRGSGKSIWNDLRTLGELNEESTEKCVTNKELAAAVCSRFSVPSNSCKSTDFCLVWDFPYAKFPLRKNLLAKYYTKYFEDKGTSGPQILAHCLNSYKNWEKSIYEWQNPILNRNDIPKWYKNALFNELYYVSDGGSIWLLPLKSLSYKNDDPRQEIGHFGYLEGHEYRMYNTYDVHFYASFALAMLWPKLQAVIQYDIKDSIDQELSDRIWFLANGECDERKKKGTVPHDVGDPDEDPFFLINSYPIHDVSQWRDLNLKFVLQVYRDYSLNESKSYLNDMFPQIKTVMKKSMAFDVDNDGMIENSGSADQTYDCWIMSGTSAYCGSLWLGALHATVQIATILGDTGCFEEYSEILIKAKEAFDNKLWNGKYYNFDCSSSDNHLSIMTDQLCGLWYVKCSDPIINLLPEKNVKSTLMTIYENNVLKYYNGGQGAVNGMMPNGKVDRYSLQSEEMWTGVTHALSSLLIIEGFVKEGFKTSEGLMNTIYNRSQLAFSSPEALHGTGEFRSLGYMRPLSIWSIQLALNNRDKFQ